MSKIYRRTEAGDKACESQNAGVAVEYRRILGAIRSDVHPDYLRASLGKSYSAEELLKLLGELEDRGLVKAVNGNPERDLDFSGSLDFSEIRAAMRKRQPA